MPTVHLTLRQLQEAIESLTPEEFRQLDYLLDTRRRARLTEIVHKTRRNAAKVSPSPLAGEGWDEGGQATEGADRRRVWWEETRGGGT